jgi:hypothetical protein
MLSFRGDALAAPLRCLHRLLWLAQRLQQVGRCREFGANFQENTIMKSKALMAVAVAGLFCSLNASAVNNDVNIRAIGGDNVADNSQLPANVSEAFPSMSTINSLDTRTGGYKGWGPMANLATPGQPNESNPSGSYFQQKTTEAQQLAEVKGARDQVWVANAPLRSEYDNIGATRGHGSGSGGFFSRDKH